jgi:DNA-binding transcriptional ArsR family regulator
MKRWTQIFKALANLKRLSIIQLLSDGKERTVTEIAVSIHVSLPGTSKHLILLHNLDILKNDGKDGHVFYLLNDSLPSDIKKAINLFLK